MTKLTLVVGFAQKRRSRQRSGAGERNMRLANRLKVPNFDKDIGIVENANAQHAILCLFALWRRCFDRLPTSALYDGDATTFAEVSQNRITTEA
ncbi:hypothetical protein [Rhizobium ecuadorense]|uniref:hypothetical protein n=1 Tax=Rhizobium ecuadorense TaxID=1671795 RepID=UPI00128EE42E|nr:hypothetical protein [Rhizobium ecuadorense]